MAAALFRNSAAFPCGTAPHREQRLDRCRTDLILQVSGRLGERNRTGIGVECRGGEQARRCEAGSLKPLQDPKRRKTLSGPTSALPISLLTLLHNVTAAVASTRYSSTNGLSAPHRLESSLNRGERVYPASSTHLHCISRSDPSDRAYQSRRPTTPAMSPS